MSVQGLGLFDPRRGLGIPGLYSRFQRTLRSDSTYPRLLNFLGIQPGDRVLDIGCGPADILAHLPADIQYYGYDLSERYIATARARYLARRYARFDVRAVSAQTIERGEFDVVISIGVLHHLSDDQAESVFASAFNALRPGGRIVTFDGAYVRGQSPVARLLLRLDRGGHVRTVDAYLNLARVYFSGARATVLHDLLTIPYTHCIIEGTRPPASTA